MSLFSPKQTFSIEPDKLNETNLDNVIQNMQGQLDRIEHRVTVIESLVRDFTPSTNDKPSDDEPSPSADLNCNTLDYMRFDYLVDKMSHPLVATTDTLVKVLDDSTFKNDRSTVKNMIRRMRNTDQFEVEILTRLADRQCVYRITDVQR